MIFTENSSLRAYLLKATISNALLYQLHTIHYRDWFHWCHCIVLIYTNNSLSFWPFSLRFLSALKIPIYHILQPDLQPKIYLVLGLWSYLVVKIDFHGTIDLRWTQVSNNKLFFPDIINVTVRSELLSGTCIISTLVILFINLHQIICPPVILTEKIWKSCWI